MISLVNCQWSHHLNLRIYNAKDSIVSIKCHMLFQKILLKSSSVMSLHTCPVASSLTRLSVNHYTNNPADGKLNSITLTENIGFSFSYSCLDRLSKDLAVDRWTVAHYLLNIWPTRPWSFSRHSANQIGQHGYYHKNEWYETQLLVAAACSSHLCY